MQRRISAVVAFLHITGSSRLLDVLKDDKKAIFAAASQASRAVSYLAGLQPKPEAELAPERNETSQAVASSGSTPEGPA